MSSDRLQVEGLPGIDMAARGRLKVAEIVGVAEC